jgi:hypothetical protein
MRPRHSHFPVQQKSGMYFEPDLLNIFNVIGGEKAD